MSVTNRLVFDPAAASSSSSIRAYLRSSDGTLLTHTTDGSNENLDVSVWLDSANADDFGIFAEDTAAGAADLGSNILAVRKDTAASLVDTDGDYSSLQLDATGRLRVTADLESSAEYEEDSAHTTGDIGNFVLAVRNDTKAALAGTDGDYIPFQMNSDGELYVSDEDALTKLTEIDTVLDNIYIDTSAMVVDLAAIEVLLTSIDSDTTDIKTAVEIIDDIVQEEDAAHSTGDKGVMGLAVRNDTLASLVSTDGDYAPLQVDADGSLYVTLSEDINVDVNDVCNVAIENTATAISTTAVNIVASALANRSKVFVANEGNKSLYMGKTGVTIVNGFPLHPGMQHEYNLGPAVAMQSIGEAGSAAEDLRVMEMS